MKWFNSQSRLIQIILLLIPFVNWITELYVRWTAYLDDQKDGLKLVLALVVTIFGLFFGWVDIIWCLLFNHLVYAK